MRMSFDGYAWAIWAQPCSSIWFGSLRSAEGGRRGVRRIVLTLRWQAAQNSLAWQRGLTKERSCGERFTCMVQEFDKIRGEAMGEWMIPCMVHLGLVKGR